MQQDNLFIYLVDAILTIAYSSANNIHENTVANVMFDIILQYMAVHRTIGYQIQIK